MTELVKLLEPKPLGKLSEIQQSLEQKQTFPVLPLGIIEAKPIVDEITSSAHLTAEALHETSNIIRQLKEQIEQGNLKPDSSPEILSKLDQLLASFAKVGQNADLEREVLLKIKAHPELNR